VVDVPAPAHASGTFAIAGELVVHRLGFGAMRLPGVRDPTVPVAKARDLLCEAVRLGVDLIDTAWIYGRSEELIADALHPSGALTRDAADSGHRLDRAPARERRRRAAVTA
jgi:diketogulonate reductase-like aldo/keto reductase